MNKSGLSIKEYLDNVHADINNNVVIYGDCKFIAKDVKDGKVDLYGSLASDQPCHAGIDICLVEFK